MIGRVRRGVSVRQNCISVHSPSEWKSALDGISHGFAHTWESSFAAHLTTRLTTYLYCFEGEGARIVCPLSERTLGEHVDIVTPYGLSGFAGTGECTAFSPHWKEFARQRGYVCGYISLNPLFDDATYYDSADVYESKTLYFLDLTKSAEKLFADLDTNRKRQLRHWRTTPPPVVLDKPALTQFLLSSYPDFVRRRNATSAYRFSRETLSYLAGLENVVMAGAEEAGRIVALSMFAYTPAAGEYLFNVSLPGARHHSVLLLWYGATHLKSVGVPFLNLGGGIEEHDGVARFKERFGAMKLSLRALKQVYTPDVYSQLCARTNADPRDTSGYFPAYRAP